MEKENITLNEILNIAEKEREDLKHPYVGSEHLFLSIIKNNNFISDYLKKYHVTYSSFKKELISVVGSCTKDLNENLYTPLLRKIIKRTETVNSYIENIYENLFISMLDEGEGIAIRILLRMDVDLDEIYFNLKEKEKLNKMEESNKIGILLNDSININEKVLCREEEINKLILTLTRKKKCNPLLIGPAGVGKTAIVEELVRRIEKGKVPSSLINNKVYMIEMGSLISGTRYRGDFEERLNKIIKEIKNNRKSIIFIDEIHSMVGAGGADGAINASDILKPYLARGEIKIIGATTNIEYNKSILKDKALARRFDVINVSEPNKEEMYKLLSSVKKEYEEFHNIKIPKKLINKILDISNYYIKNIANPDKSIDLLDSSCAYAKINNKLELTEEDVIETIFNKTNNCFIKKDSFSYKLSKDLNKYLNKVDIKNIVNVFKKSNDTPYSFIVNDEKIINILKNELEGINIIEIDINMINGFLFTGKNIDETIFSPLIEKPYSLIIIKNINTSNKMIIDELVKINKDGYICLNNNEKLYFNSAVVIGFVNDSNIYETGFNKTKRTNIINKELLASFKLDLRNITLKEYNYS